MTERSEGIGEGGIRTPPDLLDSASCRFYIAANAVNASNAVAPCTRLHPARLLETEVLGLQPLNLAVAFDDHRRALVLAAKHRFSHSSLEGFIDHSSVLAANSIDVFLRFRLHSVRDYRRD